MKAQIEVLSAEERTQVHERSLKLLATSGVRILSERGRQILKNAGAEGDINSDIVRFPRPLDRRSTEACTPKIQTGRTPSRIGIWK